jgi:hypothetical protein
VATTGAAIRDAMIALVEAITPSTHAGDKFIAHREVQPLRDWAEANPGGCLRRFSIRSTGQPRPAPVSTTLVEETSDTFEIVVAYPTDGRQGEDWLLDLDDAIESDQTSIHKTIGPPGYASLTATATVIHEDPFTREDGSPVTFGVIRYRVDWYRSVA